MKVVIRDAVNKCVFILCILFLLGCSSTPSSQTENQTLQSPQDPFESVNRPIWDFTWNYADKYVLKPVSESYVKYMPIPLRTGVYNVALNLNEPSTIINHLLQAKFTEAAKSTGRFAINSTVGLLGFFDLAESLGWKRQQEEFGEVLGKYGVDDGPYLVVPLLGPSSVREEVGDFVDRYYWPLAVLDFWPNILRSTVLGLEARAALADQESLLNESLDSYEFVKNAYFQNMMFKVYDGHPPIGLDAEEEEDIDAYLEELEELDIDY